MINKKVIISDTRISYSDDSDKIVMDVVSKELMEFYASIVTQQKGKILDVGFGLGYSADAIYNKVKNYTCIECNYQIYLKALKWAKGKENVNIIYGDWVDIIPTLTQKFNGIFMDTYDDINYNFFEEHAETIAADNCVLSIFSYFSLRDVKDLNSHYFPIINSHRKNYPKTIEEGHTVHWTYFVDGKFIKRTPYVSI